MLVSLLGLAVTPRPSSRELRHLRLDRRGKRRRGGCRPGRPGHRLYARETVALPREQSRGEAARQADERDGLRHRLERVGELLVELRLGAGRTAMGLVTAEPGGAAWWIKPVQDRLALALAGFDERLPRCFAVLEAKTADEVLERIDNARSEVDLQIQQLGSQDQTAG